jgi:aminoglycoside/choline kinase family phosphotransferase
MQPKFQDDTEEKRAQQMRAFVDQTAWKGVPIEPLRVDVSIRRFFRVDNGNKTAVLMDARPPLEDTAVFELMQKKLDAMDINVPDIYAADHAQGLVLMEDFGDVRYFERVTQGTDDLEMLYSLAVDVLVKKYFADPALALAHSVAYSDDYWLFRVEQFLQHFVPNVMGRAVTEEERAEFLSLYKTAINGAHKFGNVLLHGDYGAQNLYYLPEREGLDKLGLIDFQDLTDARGNMMGSPAFDLVFLLQDVRVDIPPALQDKMRRRFIDKTGITETVDFEGEYATIGAAQATKCLGLFARLGYVAGRKEYLQFLPYCWRNLQVNLAHPALKDIKAWFDKQGIDLANPPTKKD